MATSNSTLPVSLLDGINQANRRLEAFQAMLTPFVADLLSDDTRQHSIAAGMGDMLDDILVIHRSLADQYQALLLSSRS